MDMWKGKGKMECRRTLVRQNEYNGARQGCSFVSGFPVFLLSASYCPSIACLFCILVTGEHQYGSWTVDRMWSYWDAGVLPEALT